MVDDKKKFEKVFFTLANFFFNITLFIFCVCHRKTSEIYTIFLWISMYKSGSLFLLS